MQITIYTIKDCPFCKEEKDYLTSLNLAFTEKNVEEKKEYLDEMLNLSDNFAGVPFTLIVKDDGSQVGLKGFTREEFEEALGNKQPSDQAISSQQPIEAQQVTEEPLQIVQPQQPVDQPVVQGVHTDVMPGPSVQPIEPVANQTVDLPDVNLQDNQVVSGSVQPVEDPLNTDQPVNTQPVQPVQPNPMDLVLQNLQSMSQGGVGQATSPQQPTGIQVTVDTLQTSQSQQPVVTTVSNPVADQTTVDPINASQPVSSGAISQTGTQQVVSNQNQQAQDQVNPNSSSDMPSIPDFPNK